MKRFSMIFTMFFSLLMFTASSVFSQGSGFRTQTGEGLPNAAEGLSAKSTSFHNVWGGATFGYQVAGQEALQESPFFNANVLYDIPLGQWHFPIVGNLTYPMNVDLADAEIGTFPWTILNEDASGGVLVLHGGLSYKVLPVNNGDSQETFKVLAGFEYSYPLGENNLPLTVSVTPAFESQSELFSLEATVITPIAPNLGLLLEFVQPLGDNGLQRTLNAGVVIKGAVGGDAVR